MIQNYIKSKETLLPHKSPVFGPPPSYSSLVPDGTYPFRATSALSNLHRIQSKEQKTTGRTIIPQMFQGLLCTKTRKRDFSNVKKKKKLRKRLNGVQHTLSNNAGKLIVLFMKISINVVKIHRSSNIEKRPSILRTIHLDRKAHSPPTLSFCFIVTTKFTTYITS